ncbi:ganglioside GM2 activator-like [Myxocyprinus asiaticus]|uniref:ganglioside GM2 activator-like n=1 Tax=Myxocyprinus asiaticus TaxID=70543 RepID=UPI002223B698|nr:ganglioside GM2 activator-like [Myxocyprinus asiaticus]
MKSRISVFITLFAANYIFLDASCNLHSRDDWKLTKVLGFSWANCGKSGDPAYMKTLNLTPDPIPIPGQITADASGTTSVELTSPLSVNVTLEREVVGVWVKIPCIDELGSCHYPNVCDLLDQLTPPGQDCPEPLHTYGLPCHCPFKAGDYSLPSSDIYIPEVELPGWLTNGNYKVQGILGNSENELGCLEVSVSLHSLHMGHYETESHSTA